MSLSLGQFIGLLVFSVMMVVWHSYWKKENLKFIKQVGRALENVLKPKDQNYTWLGGVIGFSAEYETEAYGRVKVVFTTLPRQSLLYLPVALLLGRRDRLELLVSLKKKPALQHTKGIQALEYDNEKKALFVRFKVKRSEVSELEELLEKLLT